MKIVFTGDKGLVIEDSGLKANQHKPNWITADVLYCGICKVDSKLWAYGHKDLILPRIAGHEMVVSFDGNNYAVWPGIVCGTCYNCLNKQENICTQIKIIGFNVDGGFANKITVPENCLIPLPEKISLQVSCFAEPVGCIINAFEKLNLKENSEILILGAGTIGLLIGVVAKYYKLKPSIIEKEKSKIKKASSYIRLTSITIEQSCNKTDFDYVINACDDSLAFVNSLEKVKKGGEVIHFSGLQEKTKIDSKAINLLHYKEIHLVGAYGLTKKHMEKSLLVLQSSSAILEILIEKVIKPKEIESALRRVLGSDSYKYIISFSN